MSSTELDVIIIGAGLSGVGAACHLEKECPGKRYAILEARDALGGTWDLFRYPGIRSDSDMFTLGYRFKPWVDKKSIAAGETIRRYIGETADEYGVREHIRFQHKVISSDWNSKAARWTLNCENGEQLTARFVIFCGGYYRYDQGYEPDFAGRDHFSGDIIHPQQWPEDYDYSGKRVVIIGSGATAVTLLPSMAEKASKVVMLQRSPSYIVSLPNEEQYTQRLRKYLPAMWAYRITRTRKILMSMLTFKLSRKFPDKIRQSIQGFTEQQLAGHSDIKHFTPDYKPWDQRMCMAPDGDFYAAIRSGKAEVLTAHIDCFTEKGIRLKTGEELEADLIVTATGLVAQSGGGIDITIDGDLYPLPDKLMYKGLMMEDLPNFGMIMGYTNASWTLKSDLVSEFLCRVINHLDDSRLRSCTPRNRDPNMERKDFIDLKSGYVLRAANQTPKQGSRWPWRLYQNYLLDLVRLRFGRLGGKELEWH